ncbi:hypothetical protein P8452_14628 [Trifolium repens]|nr:hypothetical protein P8452_14628 [Trifolium repens]
MTPILAIAACVDAFQSTLQGVARGCGWQKFGAFVNLRSFYLAGIPLCVVLAFVIHMKNRFPTLVGISCAKGRACADLCVRDHMGMFILAGSSWIQRKCSTIEGGSSCNA